MDGRGKDYNERGNSSGGGVGEERKREREVVAGCIFVMRLSIPILYIIHTPPTKKANQNLNFEMTNKIAIQTNRDNTTTQLVAANPKEKSPLWLKFMEGGEFTATV